jgi:hypothetical protein
LRRDTGTLARLGQRPAPLGSLFERFVERFHLPAEAGPVAGAERVERGAVLAAAASGGAAVAGRSITVGGAAPGLNTAASAASSVGAIASRSP